MTYTCSPFADATLRTSEHTKCSFHALPLSKGASLRGSPYKECYKALLGNLDCEISIGSPFLDCLAFPENELMIAENMAAKTFGADATLFGTSGTTISNEIVIRALISYDNIRVLADRGLHQSVHFALNTRNVDVDYIPAKTLDKQCKIDIIDLTKMKQMIASAEKQNKPYELLILNGQSYEGTAYKLETIIQSIVEVSSSLRTIFVDEAWGASNFFHPVLKKSSAMAAANSDIAIENNISFVSTQSAHKSMSTLRQGSMIHVKGNEALIEALKTSRYRYHTTSPNIPIIASLDLARAQMATEGHKLLEQAISLARDFGAVIENNNDLRSFQLINIPVNKVGFDHVFCDPTKVLISSNIKSLDGKLFRNTLFNEYGIYVSRVVGNAILFNFHIGIRDIDVTYLVESLRKIEKRFASRNARKSSDFIIPYPPGVPLTVPGEELDNSVKNRILAAKLEGASIISINSQ